MQEQQKLKAAAFKSQKKKDIEVKTLEKLDEQVQNIHMLVDCSMQTNQLMTHN